MRIAHCIRALIAVLGLAAVIQPVVSNDYFNDTLNEFSYPRSTRRQRSVQSRMNRKHRQGQFPSPKECCPTTEELIEPLGGRNKEGIYVTLYRDKDYKQRFYEVSCKDGVLNKPCKYVRKNLTSTCVQKHSYTYALVSIKDIPSHRNFPTFPAQGYILDYIRINSGCTCSVMPHKKRKKD